MILVLMVFSVLMVLGTFIMGFMVTENKQSLNHQYRIQAYYIARSGAEVVEAAILGMSDEEIEKLDKELDKGELVINDNEFDDGKYNIILERDNGNIEINSIGTFNNAQTSVIKVILRQKESGNGQIQVNSAIHSENGITLTGGGTIIGDISSNNGPLNISGGHSLTGNKYVPLENKKSYPAPLIPSFPKDLIDKGDFINDWNHNKQIVTSSGYYRNFKIISNSEAIIDTTKGDINIGIGYLDLAGHIKIKGDNKVCLFIENINYNNTSNWYINQKKIINGREIEGNKDQFEIYHKGEKIILTGNSKIHGSMYLGDTNVYIENGTAIYGDIVTSGSKVKLTGGTYTKPKIIYAPNADVSILEGANIVGAIIGKTLKLDGGFRVEYNKNNNDLEIPSVPIEPSDTTIFKPGYYK